MGPYYKVFLCGPLPGVFADGYCKHILAVMVVRFLEKPSMVAHSYKPNGSGARGGGSQIQG